MKKISRRLLLNSVFFAGSIWSSLAQEPSESDPVFVFNRICYAQVPNVEAIRRMALQLAWNPMDGDDLKRFTTVENPPVMEGWDAQVGERLYRVGLMQSGLNARLKQTFPDFTEGTATSCTLVLDEEHKAETFLANMCTLAGKEPIGRDVAEGDLRTTTWAGGNADLKVFLFAKTSPEGQGGLLNVTILQK